MALNGPKMTWNGLKWTHWNCHLKPSPFDFCFSCNHFEWSHDQYTTILSLGPKIAEKVPNDQKWPECLKSDSWNHLHWSFASLAVIFSGHMTCLRQSWIWGGIWPKMAKTCQKRPQMTKNGLNVWKVRSETMSIGFLLLLRSFWVVTWLVCDNFEFGAKMAKNGQNGQKRPKMAPNDQKWPECLKSDYNWLIWCCHSSYRPILSTSANFIQQWGWTGQKSQFWHPENFFMECHYRSYFIIFIHPKCKISEN